VGSELHNTMVKGFPPENPSVIWDKWEKDMVKACREFYNGVRHEVRHHLPENENQAAMEISTVVLCCLILTPKAFAGVGKADKSHLTELVAMILQKKQKTMSRGEFMQVCSEHWVPWIKSLSAYQTSTFRSTSPSEFSPPRAPRSKSGSCTPRGGLPTPRKREGDEEAEVGQLQSLCKELRKEAAEVEVANVWKLKELQAGVDGLSSYLDDGGGNSKLAYQGAQDPWAAGESSTKKQGLTSQEMQGLNRLKQELEALSIEITSRTEDAYGQPPATNSQMYSLSDTSTGRSCECSGNGCPVA